MPLVVLDTNVLVPGAMEILVDLRYFGRLVEPVASFGVCSDPDDDKFVEAAVAGHADFIVTGNRKDFPLPSFQGLRIVSPSEFPKLRK